MAIITANDIYQLVYQEVMDEVTRQDADIIETCINNAIEEVKMYLPRFDLVALFGDGDTPATFTSSLLKRICSVVAVWQLFALSNPNVNYDYFHELYKMTVKQLEQIRDRKNEPSGWPLKDTTGQTSPQGSSVTYSSFKKRSNNF